MQNIASLLEKKYKYELRYFRATEIIEKNWNAIVKDLDRFLFPKNIYKNQLVIECNNPVWLSEIDCFQTQIVSKVNTLLSDHRVKITIIGLKPIFNANSSHQIKPVAFDCPDAVEDRIRWSIKKKQGTGAKLCRICEKVWDDVDPCRLCELTVH